MVSAPSNYTIQPGIDCWSSGEHSWSSCTEQNGQIAWAPPSHTTQLGSDYWSSSRVQNGQMHCAPQNHMMQSGDDAWSLSIDHNEQTARNPSSLKPPVLPLSRMLPMPTNDAWSSPMDQNAPKVCHWVSPNHVMQSG